MHKTIPFVPWQTAYSLRWLRDMSRQGWALTDIRGSVPSFVLLSTVWKYALFPVGSSTEEDAELLRRLEDGNLVVPPALDRPMPGKLTLPEEPHLATLVGQIGPYQYVQPVNQLRRDNGWELVYDWGSFSVMRRLRPDAGADRHI